MSPLAVALVGLPVGIGLLELALDGLRGGGHATLPIYASVAPPALVAGADLTGLFGVTPYVVQLDGRGARRPSAPRGVAVVGDSIAFGLGLPGEATLAAQCTALGRPAFTAAAPAFSLSDALQYAERFAADADGWLVVVNATDDDAPPLADTAALAGRWLVRDDAPAPVRTLLASPLGASHLLHDALMVLAARPAAPEVRLGFEPVAAALAAFVGRHPDTRVLWAAPAPDHPDHAGAGVGLAALRAHVAVEAIDLPEGAWLADRVHWSAAGTAAVAATYCGAGAR